MSVIKLRKTDTVVVISGKYKKKSGKILKIDKEKFHVVVEGVNLIKKSQKPKSQGEKGTFVERENGIHISNVMIACPKCGPVRIAVKMDAEKKLRVCKKCGGVL